MPRVSVNILTKDQVTATARAISSLTLGFLKEDDEVLVLDTGSSPDNLKDLKTRLGLLETDAEIRILHRPDLSVPFGEKIAEWLPERIGQFEEDDQYKDLEGIIDFAAARWRCLELASTF